MKNRKERKQLIYLVFMVMVLVTALGIVTYAWLTHHNSMITMAPIIHPGNIAITGPDGTAMEALDLSYSNDDITVDEDGNKRVTIQRKICVKSTEEQFDLEIVHTTNMKGLAFSLLPADGQGKPYSGHFLNLEKQTDNNGKLEYNYANGTMHEINFDNYSNVQVHAEPLYWKVDGPLSSDKDHTVEEDFAGERVTYYLTNYVLSVTWIEENKETDMFYLLAKNVENNSQN